MVLSIRWFGVRSKFVTLDSIELSFLIWSMLVCVVKNNVLAYYYVETDTLLFSIDNPFVNGSQIEVNGGYSYK